MQNNSKRPCKTVIFFIYFLTFILFFYCKLSTFYYQFSSICFLVIFNFLPLKAFLCCSTFTPICSSNQSFESGQERGKLSPVHLDYCWMDYFVYNRCFQPFCSAFRKRIKPLRIRKLLEKMSLGLRENSQLFFEWTMKYKFLYLFI